MAQLLQATMTGAAWQAPSLFLRADRAGAAPSSPGLDAVHAHISGMLGAPTPALNVAVAGCGAGEQCRLWAGYGHRVYGADPDGAKVLMARQRAFEPGMEILFDVAHTSALPWPDRSMDLVFAPAMLEQAADWRAGLAELARVLRAGGMLGLAWPGAYRLRVQLTRHGMASLDHVALAGLDADGRARRAAFALRRAVPPLRFCAAPARPAPCLLVFKAA